MIKIDQVDRVRKVFASIDLGIEVSGKVIGTGKSDAEAVGSIRYKLQTIIEDAAMIGYAAKAIDTLLEHRQNASEFDDSDPWEGCDEPGTDTDDDLGELIDAEFDEEAKEKGIDE